MMVEITPRSLRHFVIQSSGPQVTRLPSPPTRTPLSPNAAPTLSAPIIQFRPLGFMCVCGQFYPWLVAQWFGCFANQINIFQKKKKKKNRKIKPALLVDTHYCHLAHATQRNTTRQQHAQSWRSGGSSPWMTHSTLEPLRQEAVGGSSHAHSTRD